MDSILDQIIHAVSNFKMSSVTLKQIFHHRSQDEINQFHHVATFQGVIDEIKRVCSNVGFVLPEPDIEIKKPDYSFLTYYDDAVKILQAADNILHTFDSPSNVAPEYDSFGMPIDKSIGLIDDKPVV